MSMYLIFWDGVGYGRKDAGVNPFFSAHLPALRTLCGEDLFSLRHTRTVTKLATISPVNATLGVAGLPQSGTGQTALFAGVNASKIIGKHFGPYPYSTLMPIIDERNIFKELRLIGASGEFVNGFPDRYLDHLSAHQSKVPVIARAYLSVAKKLHTHRDVAAGRALSADIIGSRWKELGHSTVKEMHPALAGNRFYTIGKNFDFSLFEYFLTDKAGHSQDPAFAVDVLERMDAFIDGFMTSFDFELDTLLIISDHGNIEDLSTRSHTRNQVPLITAGAGRDFFSGTVKRLNDLTPAVVGYVKHMRRSMEMHSEV